MTHAPGPHGRRVWFLALAVVALAGAGAVLIMNASPPPAGVEAAAVAIDTTAATDGVVAYYFHTNYRCPSCRKIEAYSKLAVETGFEAELASGRLQWRIVNIEEEGNEHFVKDYKLYTKSLILSDQRSGHEVRWKNLTRVWELLGNEADFVDYVQKETRAFMAEAP